MSAIFQRPLCDMGKAYDFSFRPQLGDADTGAGGPCDDRPHRVELYAAATDPTSPNAEWQSFSLCPEHEDQLRRYDARLPARGVSTRFRPGGKGAVAP
ncbi:MAG: hypothetical protein WBF81_05435 [Thermoplasmata archaeon]